VVDGEAHEAISAVNQALSDNIPLNTILDDALIAAMEEVGGMFSDGTIFVPEMLLSARAMKGGLEILRPLLTKTSAKPKGLVMLATVQGDVHDIGKNLVGMMLEGAGYKVVDLGVNKDSDEILAQARALNPDVIGLSALLTTTMPLQIWPRRNSSNGLEKGENYVAPKKPDGKKKIFRKNQFIRKEKAHENKKSQNPYCKIE